MDVGVTTFTTSEITSLLAAEGIQQGSPRFGQEVNRRFFRTDGGLYIERPDWEPTARDQVDHRRIDVC